MYFPGSGSSSAMYHTASTSSAPTKSKKAFCSDLTADEMLVAAAEKKSGKSDFGFIRLNSLEEDEDLDSMTSSMTVRDIGSLKSMTSSLAAKEITETPKKPASFHQHHHHHRRHHHNHRNHHHYNHRRWQQQQQFQAFPTFPTAAASTELFGSSSGHMISHQVPFGLTKGQFEYWTSVPHQQQNMDQTHQRLFPATEEEQFQQQQQQSWAFNSFQLSLAAAATAAFEDQQPVSYTAALPNQWSRTFSSIVGGVCNWVADTLDRKFGLNGTTMPTAIGTQNINGGGASASAVAAPASSNAMDCNSRSDASVGGGGGACNKTQLNPNAKSFVPLNPLAKEFHPKSPPPPPPTPPSSLRLEEEEEVTKVAAASECLSPADSGVDMKPVNDREATPWIPSNNGGGGSSSNTSQQNNVPLLDEKQSTSQNDHFKADENGHERLKDDDFEEEDEDEDDAVDLDFDTPIAAYESDEDEDEEDDETDEEEDDDDDLDNSRVRHWSVCSDDSVVIEFGVCSVPPAIAVAAAAACDTKEKSSTSSSLVRNKSSSSSSSHHQSKTNPPQQKFTQQNQHILDAFIIVPSDSEDDLEDEDDDDEDDDGVDQVDGDILAEFQNGGLLNLTCCSISLAAVEFPTHIPKDKVQERIAAANQTWNRNYGDDEEEDQSVQKKPSSYAAAAARGRRRRRRLEVCIAPVEANVVIYEDPDLAEALSASRKSDFVQRQADKERMERLLAPVFTKTHRQKMWQLLQHTESNDDKA